MLRALVGAAAVACSAPKLQNSPRIRRADLPWARTTAGAEVPMRYGFEEEAYGLLIAGRVIDGDLLTMGKTRRILELVEDWADRLREDIVCVPCGDLSQETSALQDADRTYLPLVVGLNVRAVSANDGPSSPATIEEMRESVTACQKALPDAFWAALADMLTVGERNQLLSAPHGLQLVATGPMATASLTYGFVLARDDAEELREPYVGGQDMYEEPHDFVVVGVEIETVGPEQPVPVDLDLTEEAHAKRAAIAEYADEESYYYLIARYD